MAKTLANYDPLVQIPSGMTPAGADFPIVESHDILVGENDKRLDAKLDDIDSAIGNVGQTPIATQLSSKVNTGDIVTSVAATGSTSNNKIPSETAVRAAIEAKTINVDSTVTQGSTNAVSGGAVHTQLATKQDTLTFDTTPTASSSNPVTSGGIKTALDAKQNTLTFDTAPTASSSNPVTSGGVKAALDTKQNTLTYETTPIAGSVNPVTSTGIRNAIDAAAASNLGQMQAAYAEFVADADAVLDRASSLSNGMVACSNIAAETTVGDTRILLYTGTTNANYTNGHWYYNSAPSNAAPSWTDGGAVGSAPTIDNTLAIDGAAANSKSVGDAIENIVTISNTQPGSNSGNKVWIKETTDEEVQVPTYAEHIAKANKADIATNNESDNGSGTISASKAYVIGDHFYINNTNTSSENYGVSTLYKATAAIASGDAIVVGTNCEASKVADEITSLSNDIGTVKADLNYIGYTKTAQPFNDNAYINTKVNVGSTVSTTPVSSSSYAWSMVSCSAGDRFLISGHGGDSPRFWAFTDGSYKLISKAGNAAQSEGLILVAPADGYIIINSTRSTAHALYALTPASVQGQIDTLVDNTGADMYVDVGEWVNGSIVATNGSIGSTVDVSNPTANSNFAYVVIEVAIGDILRVTAYGGSAPRAWAFTDASYKLISQAASGGFADDVTLTAPANGYLICNSQKTRQGKLLDYRVLKKTLVTAKVKFAEVDETIVEKASTDIGVIIDNWLYKSTIQDNVSVGDTVTTTPVNSSQYASMIVACSKDDKYIITGTGGASALLWAFTDTSYKLLSKSGASASERDLLITASANGYLIVNVAYNYDYLLQKVTKVETADALDDFKEESYPNPFAEIIMPSKIRVCGGVEMSIYYKSILRYMDASKVNLIAPTNIGYLTRYKDFCRITPADNANSNFNNRINVYVGNTKVADIASNRHRIDMIPKTAGDGLSKKVLLIGDSLTDADVYLQELSSLFADDVMDITFLGTRDTGAVPNEGYSAWRAYTFAKCANATDDGIGTANVNPFYNATAEQFDFTYYMTQQGYTGVDYVFICLGVNDLAKNDHFNDFTDYYDILIDSIHDYDPTIRIGIWLPPCRGLMANADRTAFDRGLYADKKLIEVYDGRESELIYLVPVYLNIDPEHDFNSQVIPISTRNPDVSMTICTDNVHPANSGYYKAADVIYSMIKYFGRLDESS